VFVKVVVVVVTMRYWWCGLTFVEERVEVMMLVVVMVLECGVNIGGGGGDVLGRWRRWW